MQRRMIAALSALLLISVAFSVAAEAKSATREEMQLMIARELPIGSDAKAINAFFHRHHLGYTYDDFANKYDSIVRYDRFNGITIQISVDKKGAMRNAEVESYTTMP